MNIRTIRAASPHAVIAVALLFAMWAGSLWVYEREKMADALEWRWAELHGEPLYAWHFDDPAELVRGHGLSGFTWAGGTVSGKGQDPYFYLNLEGRSIDAERFTGIRLRLRSENENALRLFHQQGRRDQIHASELIPLAAGWQMLTLSLPALDWHTKDLADPDAPAPDSSWGGETGVVTALRIDPVRSGAFEVDWIEVSDSGNRPRAVDEIATFASLDDPLFDRMREQTDRTWHIADERRVRTPETEQWARREIARFFPSAVVFPRPPTEQELTFPPFETRGMSAFIPAGVFIAALLVLVVRDQVPSPWRSLVAVIALFTMLEAFIYWLPHLSQLWKILLAVPLLGAMWELVPKSAPRYILGDRRAWLLVSPVIVISLVVLVAFPFEGFEAYSAPKSLGRYFLWALVQQFVVAVLILSRLREVFGKAAIVLGAGIFGLLHFPNFALMVATFLLGIGLLLIYERYQNLLAIAAAQAFLAVSFNTLALKFFWLSRTIGPEFTAAL